AEGGKVVDTVDADNGSELSPARLRHPRFLPSELNHRGVLSPAMKARAATLGGSGRGDWARRSGAGHLGGLDWTCRHNRARAPGACLVDLCRRSSGWRATRKGV